MRVAEPRHLRAPDSGARRRARVGSGDDERGVSRTACGRRVVSPRRAARRRRYPCSTADVVAVVDLCRARAAPIVPFGSGTSLEGQVVALEEASRWTRPGSTAFCDSASRISTSPSRRASRGSSSTRVSGRRACSSPSIRERTPRSEGWWPPAHRGRRRFGTEQCGRTSSRSTGVVTPDGSVVRTRSRARKSSAGYDLTHLFVGFLEGTLGVITEATLRIYATPEAISSAVCSFASLDDAVTCVIRAIQLGIPVARIELLDDVQMDAVNRRSRLRLPGGEHPLPRISRKLGRSGGAGRRGRRHCERARCRRIRLGHERGRAPRLLWEARHAAYEAALALRPGSDGYVTDVCVPISALAGCITETRAEIDAEGSSCLSSATSETGTSTSVFLVDPDAPEELVEARSARRAASPSARSRSAGRARASTESATASRGCFHSSTETRVSASMRRLKSALDPDGIMNPGKIFPCIL